MKYQWDFPSVWKHLSVGSSGRPDVTIGHSVMP